MALQEKPRRKETDKGSKSAPTVQAAKSPPITSPVEDQKQVADRVKGREVRAQREADFLTRLEDEQKQVNIFRAREPHTQQSLEPAIQCNTFRQQSL